MKKLIYLSILFLSSIFVGCEINEPIEEDFQQETEVLETSLNLRNSGIYVHHISHSSCCVTFHLLKPIDGKTSEDVATSTNGKDGKEVVNWVEQSTLNGATPKWYTAEVTVCLPPGIQTGEVCVTIPGAYTYNSNVTISSNGTVCAKAVCVDRTDKCVYILCFEDIHDDCSKAKIIINGQEFSFEETENFNDNFSGNVAKLAEYVANNPLLPDVSVHEYMDDVYKCSKQGDGHTGGIFIVAPPGAEIVFICEGEKIQLTETKCPEIPISIF